MSTSGAATFPLELLSERFAVARFASASELEPDLRRALEQADGGLVCVTRTAEELSVLAPESCFASSDQQELEAGFRALRVSGTLDFSLIGVLSQLLEPLAARSISVFVVSTFDTDFLLVKAEKLDAAVATLRAKGHSVQEAAAG